MDTEAHRTIHMVNVGNAVSLKSIMSLNILGVQLLEYTNHAQHCTLFLKLNSSKGIVPQDVTKRTPVVRLPATSLARKGRANNGFKNNAFRESRQQTIRSPYPLGIEGL